MVKCPECEKEYARYGDLKNHCLSPFKLVHLADTLRGRDLPQKSYKHRSDNHTSIANKSRIEL